MARSQSLVNVRDHKKQQLDEAATGTQSSSQQKKVLDLKQKPIQSESVFLRKSESGYRVIQNVAQLNNDNASSKEEDMKGETT